MNRYILVGVALLAVVLLVAGAVLIAELYLKPSPATSTEFEPSTGVSPSVIPTTAVATPRTESGSSQDTRSEGMTPTGVTPLVLSKTAVAPPRTGSGSSQDTSSDGVSPNTVSPSVIPTTAVATTRTVSGPPSFTLLVTPVEARARPGDTIRYTLSIVPKGGFDQTVSLHLDVSALFLYRNSFDLGTVSPPFPTTLEYSFTVPNDVPGGIIVKGVLSAEGGGYREEQDLVLIVGN
jgi:hypothetical protein